MLNRQFKADCEAVGRLIAPTDTPPWLAGYLVHWSNELASEISVARMHLTKASVRRKLTSVGEVADVLDGLLNDTMLMDFFQKECRFEIDKDLPGLRRALPLISAHAHRAAALPSLSKKGRGKATPTGFFGPKIFCALVVAEGWNFVRRKYPNPGNRTAARAASTYWRTSGGEETEWGNDPLKAWQPWFRKALGVKFRARRAECRRVIDAAANGSWPSFGK